MWSPYNGDIRPPPMTGFNPETNHTDNALTLQLCGPVTSKGPCSVCGVSSKFRCGGCPETFYCSRKHQTTDWGRHKGLCRPFVLPAQWNPNSGNGTTKKNNKDPPERPKWITASRELTSGSTILGEKPILVTPNVIPGCHPTSTRYRVCLGCSGIIDDAKSSLTSGLVPCTRCLLPICYNCHQNGHDGVECAAVGGAVSKNRAVMLTRIDEDNHTPSASLIRDITILKVLLLCKRDPANWAQLIMLRTNSRFAANQKDPTDGVKMWLNLSDYPVSEVYFKSGNISGSGGAGNPLKLEDVILLFAVFSDIAPHTGMYRVLYLMRSWIGHACTPTAEFHYHPSDPTLTLWVKSVSPIKEDSIISVNFMATDYSEGLSKSAIRLWHEARLFCGEKTCPCRYPGRVDGSVGIRCGKVHSASADFGSCSGFLAPLMDPPNPDKPHLGILIYNKSKIWNCSRCRRSEKFGTIMRQAKEIGEKMKDLVESYCAKGSVSNYDQLAHQLLDHVGDQHCLWCKVNDATLSIYNETLTGSGREMLTRFVRLLPGSDSRTKFVTILRWKRDLYGDGVFPTLPKAFLTQATMKGVLTLLSLRHGRHSWRRGEALMDAFFTNLILWGEEFKLKVESLGNDRVAGMNALVAEVMSKWKMFLKLAQEASGALHSPIFPSSDSRIQSEFARELVAIFSQVVAQGVKSPVGSSALSLPRIEYILTTVTRFMTRFFATDTKFSKKLAHILLSGQENSTDSTNNETVDYLQNMFDPGSKNLSFCHLTFGPAAYNGGDLAPVGKEWDDDNDLYHETVPDLGPKSKKKHDFLDLSDSESNLFEDDDDGDDDDDDDFDVESLFGGTSPLAYYQELLNASLRQRMQTEELLAKLYR